VGTKIAILNMPASREMDAWIAEIVGWVIEDFTAISPRGSKWARNAHGDDDWLPYYSTDISAAWEVVDKYTDAVVEKVGDHYCVNLFVSSACAETAPLAICRAALFAVMEGKNE